MPGALPHDLEPILAGSPAGSTVVVFPTAVVSYLPPRREVEALARWARAGPFVRLSNEAASVLPDVAAPLDRPAGAANLVSDSLAADRQPARRPAESFGR